MIGPTSAGGPCGRWRSGHADARSGGQLISAVAPHIGRASTGTRSPGCLRGVEWKFASPWPRRATLFRLQFSAGVPRADLKVRTRTHVSGAEAIPSRRSVCLTSGAGARAVASARRDRRGPRGASELRLLVDVEDRSRLAFMSAGERLSYGAPVVTVGAGSESTPSACRSRPTPSRAQLWARAATHERKREKHGR